MKISRLVLLCCLILLTIGTTSSQTPGKFGVGVAFGEPTGFAWKYRINQSNAVDGAIGFSPYDRYRIHVDYLWQSRPFKEPQLALHYGVGVALGFGRTEYFVVERSNRIHYFLRDQEMGFAVRIPFGLSYMIPRSPLDIFVEVAPLMIFAPGTGVGMDASLGARFYF